MQDAFEGNSTVDLFIETYTTHPADEKTSPEVSGGTHLSLTIGVHEFDCQIKHQADVLSTYFHELMHASMKKAAWDLNGPDGTPNDYLCYTMKPRRLIGSIVQQGKKSNTRSWLI